MPETDAPFARPAVIPAALKPRRGFLIPAFRPGVTAFDQVAALNCFPTETRFLLLDGSQPTLEKNIRKLPIPFYSNVEQCRVKSTIRVAAYLTRLKREGAALYEGA